MLRTQTQNPAIQSHPTNPPLIIPLDSRGSGPTEVHVPHPAVSTIATTLYAYPAVGSALTNGYHPVVVTITRHTYPAVGVLLAAIAQLLASGIDTTGVQTAPPPHRTHPPVAPLPVEAAAVAGQAAVRVTGVPNTAGGDKLDTQNTIVALNGTVSKMIG